MEEKIFVTRPFMPPLEEYISEIRELWDTRILTNMGKKHRKLESSLQKYLGVKQVSLMANGHMALELTLQAMGLTGEVITTPFTFASTIHAIVRNRLTPVFCDINPYTYTIDVDRIEELITDKTSAIVPVHVYGNICEVDKIEKIAHKYNLKVIYDAAHAFGESIGGRGVGNFGDASMFSFHATKVFHTIEGGAVCFDNEQLGLDLYRLKNFGIRGQEKVDYIGANAKMNEFQAAMGLCNLRYIDQEIIKRKKIQEQYMQELSGIEGIQFVRYQDNVKYNYAYFPVVFDENVFGAARNEVFEALWQENICSRKYFYPLASMYDCYHGQFDAHNTPVALYISQRVLALPIYGELTLEDVKKICDVIKSVRTSRRNHAKGIY